MKKYNKVEVRVGNTSNRGLGLKRIKSNVACGGIIPNRPNMFPYTTHICASPLTGRYMTAQVFDSIFFELSDINVYTVSKSIQSNTLFG